MTGICISILKNCILHVVMVYFLGNIPVNFQNICITFFLVSFGWIFFRCENLTASLQYLKSLANWNYPVNLELNHFSILVVTLFAFAVWSYSDRLTIALEKFLSQTPFAIKALLAAIFMQFILSFSPDGMPSFIYAQF